MMRAWQIWAKVLDDEVSDNKVDIHLGNLALPYAMVTPTGCQGAPP